jgi:tryptophan 2,3-dioxygenase
LLQQLNIKAKAQKNLAEQLRQLDVNVNVNWPLSHYKSAVRYLHREPEEIKATGGTNWQKYLPPRFQKECFILHYGLLMSWRIGVKAGLIKWWVGYRPVK